MRIDLEEANDLLDLIGDEDEAAELCRESGIELGDLDVSLETMKVRYSKAIISRVRRYCKSLRFVSLSARRRYVDTSPTRNCQ